PSPSMSVAVQRAEQLARSHHARYDPSHDFHHVTRVRGLALALARSLSNVDLLVVELAALAHDLLDKKYLPSGRVPTPREHLDEHLWSGLTQTDVSDGQRRLVERVVDNVSYSKEVKRIANGEQTEWHLSCPELHCVQDADKLDAMGAFGVMRCAAYSAITSRPLYLPPTPSPAPPSTSSSDTPAPAPVSDDSAIAHFHDKLLRLGGMIKTARGRELARARTETLRRFVADTEREWSE
ncbi:uncharacterized protein RHOBADRAFT_9642, partial [Rhodotorula graminis WP1]